MSDTAPIEGVELEVFIRGKARLELAPDEIEVVVRALSLLDADTWWRVERGWRARAEESRHLARSVDLFVAKHVKELRGAPLANEISHPANVEKDLFASECFKATRTAPLKGVWGSKHDQPHTGFLTMSNTKDGKAIRRHRVKLNPKRTNGQKLEMEPRGGHNYDDVIEYDFTETQPDDSEKRRQVRGRFAKLGPGEAWLAENLRAQPFRPPPYFATW